MGVFFTRKERLYNSTSAYGGLENIYARLHVMMVAIAPNCSLSRGVTCWPKLLKGSELWWEYTEYFSHEKYVSNIACAYGSSKIIVPLHLTMVATRRINLFGIWRTHLAHALTIFYAWPCDGYVLMLPKDSEVYDGRTLYIYHDKINFYKLLRLHTEASLENIYSRLHCIIAGGQRTHQLGRNG